MTAARLPQDLPSVEYLRECFDYDPETGILTWKERPRSHFATDKGHAVALAKFAGKTAGGKTRFGYLVVRVCATSILVHRAIWAMYYGAWPSKQIDHVNLNRADNRVNNLKEATNLENSHRLSLRNDNTSGILGVSWHRASRTWRVNIEVAGRAIFLGYFKRIEDAAEARKQADIKYGFAHNHGDIRPDEPAGYVTGNLPANNVSGVRGCHWDKRKSRWVATLVRNGKQTHLGTFPTLEQAAAARKQAEEEYGIVNRRGRGRKAIL